MYNGISGSGTLVYNSMCSSSGHSHCLIPTILQNKFFNNFNHASIVMGPTEQPIPPPFTPPIVAVFVSTVKKKKLATA